MISHVDIGPSFQRKTVATATFEQLKIKLDAACESLRGFTLGHGGFTQKGARSDITLVENLIDKISNIPKPGMSGQSPTTLIALSRGRIKAAARLALLKNKR